MRLRRLFRRNRTSGQPTRLRRPGRAGEGDLSPSDPGGPGLPPRWAAGNGGDPLLRGDTFLARVAEAARLRNSGATVTAVGGGSDGPAYLRVSVLRPGLLVEQRAVGANEHGVDSGAEEKFATQVHARYAAGDPHLVSGLVYGGPPADEKLAATALRRGGATGQLRGIPTRIPAVRFHPAERRRRLRPHGRLDAPALLAGPPADGPPLLVAVAPGR